MADTINISIVEGDAVSVAVSEGGDQVAVGVRQPGTPIYGVKKSVTIASGVLAAGAYRNIVVSAESLNADTLSEITGLLRGEEIILWAAAGDTITVEHNAAAATEKLFMLGNANITLDAQHPLKLSKTDTNVIVEYWSGSSSSTIAGLSDVTITAVALNEILKWNGSAWINAVISSGVTTFADLTDTVITSVASGEILKWDGTDWINNTLAEAGIAAASHTHTESDISDLQSYLLNITGEALSTLSDVTITTIAAGELLKWNGTAWINNTLVEAGIAPTSHTHTESDISDLQSYLLNIAGEALSTLSDVTITTIASGELLKWNGSAWINQTLAEGGISATGHSHTESDISDLQAYLLNITGEALSTLSDVTITTIASGELLKWNGTAWINNTLVEAGIAAASHTHVEADITDLGSYSVTGHTHVEADITDLQSYLLNITGEALSTLSDVTITTIASGELLKWNGTAWINNTLVEAGIVNNATHTGDVTGDTVLTIAAAAVDIAMLSATGTPSASNFLRGDNTWATPAGSGDMVLADAQTVSGIKTFLNTTMKLRNVANTFDGYFLNTNTADRIYTLQDAAGTIAFTSDITGTNSGTNTGDETSIVGIGGTKAQFNTELSDGTFMYVGDAPTTHTHTESDISDLQSYLLNITGEALSTLSDVTITTIASGELLKWNGSAWINNTLAEAGIAPTSHTHVEADITDLGSYSVVGHTHTESDISDLQSYLLNITGEALSTLSDVTITTIASGELLKWNGTAWINNTLVEAGIAPTSHTHVEADITDLGSYSVVGHTHVEADITDLQSYLLNITGEALSTLSDVTITTIASGELLKWNGSAWINNTLVEAGISVVGHTHVLSAGATDVTSTAAELNLLDLAGLTVDWVLSADSATTASWKAQTAAGGGDMVLADAQTNSGIKTFLDTTMKLRNVANTFDGYFVNTNTANRIYTLQDAAGTIAFTSDITGTNSGTNTGDQTTIVGITGTKAQFNTAVSDGTIMYIGDAPTSHTHVEADITDLQSYLLNITGEALSTLSDVTITTIASGELLKWNGSAWINNTLAEAGIAAASHTHVEADITDLGSYSVTGHTHVEADITDLQSYLLNITGEALSTLSDVTITTIASGEILKWDGAGWINNTLVEAGIVNNATHTGDVTGSGALTIATGVVTLAMMADMATASIIGRNTAATGVPEILSATVVRSILGIESGATADQSDAEIETAYNTQVGIVSQVNAEAGTSTTAERWTPQRVQQAIKALEAEEVIMITIPGDLTVADDVEYVRMPFAMTLTSVRASVGTAPTGAGITIDLTESGSTILSTLLTIDATEKTSETAATAAVISDSALGDDNIIGINVDVIGSTLAGSDLKIMLIGTRT